MQTPAQHVFSIATECHLSTAAHYWTDAEEAQLWLQAEKHKQDLFHCGNKGATARPRVMEKIANALGTFLLFPD